MVSLAIILYSTVVKRPNNWHSPDTIEHNMAGQPLRPASCIVLLRNSRVLGIHRVGVR